MFFDSYVCALDPTVELKIIFSHQLIALIFKHAINSRCSTSYNTNARTLTHTLSLSLLFSLSLSLSLSFVCFTYMDSTRTCKLRALFLKIRFEKLKKGQRDGVKKYFRRVVNVRNEIFFLPIDCSFLENFVNL